MRVPFEMILRNNTVIALHSSSLIRVSGMDVAERTSRIVALDTSNPSAIAEIGSFDIPGQIIESWVVGDIFYVVSFEDGSCYNCQTDPTTTIRSINLANPSAIQQMDQVAFAEAGYPWDRRRVLAGEGRIYVTDVEDDSGSTDSHSSIQVIDISDPAGTMQLGANVEVDGQVESQSQMDEHEGVLRVISQDSTAIPSLETFAVVSSDQVTPLGHLGLALPENLRSVRFDGNRVFAATSGQIVSFDLSDPTNPQQMGALETPGSLYLVPRGDRLFSLAHDDGSEAMSVSLFDISDLSVPTMIERTVLDDLPWMTDQDRIHKAFNILDEQGLILIPYAGSPSGDDNIECYQGGFQLMDFTNDSLTKRGIAPQQGILSQDGNASAFLHDDRLFTLSEASVTTFDITDRDAPAQIAEVAITYNTIRAKVVAGYLVRLDVDSLAGQARLNVLPANDLEGNEPLGTLEISSLSNPDSPCYSQGQFVYQSTLLEVGSHAVLIWENSGRTSVAVIDLSDPTQPNLVAHKTFNFEFTSYDSNSYYGYGYGGGSTAVRTPGSTIVQLGSTVALQHRPAHPLGENHLWPHSLYILDFSNPSDPVLASTVALPDSLGQTLLQLEGNTILTSHWEPAANLPGKVRFFVDRIDISSPTAPQVLPAISTPGSLITRHAASGRVATIEYERSTVDAANRNDCYRNNGATAHWDSGTAACVIMHCTIKLLDVEGSTATLLDALPLEDRLYGQLALDEDRILLVQYGWHNHYAPSQSDPTHRLMTLTGLGEGVLRLSPATPLESFSWPTFLPDGKRVVVLRRFLARVAVFDTIDAIAAPVLKKSEDLVGGWLDVSLHNDTGIFSSGGYGVLEVSLTD